ncbi:GNAT family N-acetyltransferase [Ammoniphilus resinae]|uniref:Ribosomal protein S18 acetylase RimI-like enzyme n=1 Tax=Ammoniphilus resinae TaxID=861532 RepID=A0ABS4GXI4_9BACL|nr:GNAT family N-acetyltransferase [Ammoniphilus resinae]MBP1934979.1 ribosomal protein S18 acetylase RimI-like enzyme [Ammoniphilus resinae]
MIIKRIEYENFVAHEDGILSLLTETYMMNFNLSHELSTNMSEEKVKQLHGYIKDGSAIIFAALEDEKLCGFVWIYIHDFFCEKRFHINQIALDSKYRGKGIAKKLMKKVEEHALIDGIKTIDLFVSEVNAIAHSLYEGLGFETERRYMKKKL